MIKKIVEYLSNLWYSKIRIARFERKKRSMESREGIFTAKDFACYIKKYYETKNNMMQITPIKLQKSLYFCLAYWGGFVNKGKIDGEQIGKENNILFNDRIEAWAYGPVVPSVYFDEHNMKFYKNEEEENEAYNRVKNIFDNNILLKDTINSLLDDIFEISDFKLVSISHADKSWKNHFKENASKHSEKIEQEEIINEYTTKEFS